MCGDEKLTVLIEIERISNITLNEIRLTNTQNTHKHKYRRDRIEKEKGKNVQYCHVFLYGILN